MSRKKGDLLKIKAFEAIEINKVGYNEQYNPDGSFRDKPIFVQEGVRCSITLKNGLKYWLVVPMELIEERISRE